MRYPQVYAKLDEKPIVTTSDCKPGELVDIIDPVAGEFATGRVMGIVSYGRFELQVITDESATA